LYPYLTILVAMFDYPCDNASTDGNTSVESSCDV